MWWLPCKHAVDAPPAALQPTATVTADKRVCVTARLCRSMITHAANVRYCKFSKNVFIMGWLESGRLLVGLIGSGPPRGSDRVRSS